MAKLQRTPQKPSKTVVKPSDDADGDESPDENDTDGDESPEDLDRRINSVVTSRIKRALKPFEKLLSDLGGKIDSLGKQTPSQESEDDDTDEETSTENTDQAKKPDQVATPKASPTDMKWRKRMEKQLAEERAAREKAEKAQADAAEKTKRDEERNTIMAALNKAGITDPKVARSAYLAMVEDGTVTRDEDGQVCIKSVDKYGEEQLVNPVAGASAWVKTDGKAFLPAIEAGGSGQGGAAANTGASMGKMTKGEFSKLDKIAQAKIEIERASMGLPPIGE